MTAFLPGAVGLGVLLTLVLFIYRAGQTTEVHELVRETDGQIHVRNAQEELRSAEVTVLRLGDEVVLVPGEEILGASLQEAGSLAENWMEDR